MVGDIGHETGVIVFTLPNGEDTISVLCQPGSGYKANSWTSLPAGLNMDCGFTIKIDREQFKVSFAVPDNNGSFYADEAKEDYLNPAYKYFDIGTSIELGSQDEDSKGNKVGVVTVIEPDKEPVKFYAFGHTFNKRYQFDKFDNEGFPVESLDADTTVNAYFKTGLQKVAFATDGDGKVFDASSGAEITELIVPYGTTLA